MTLLQAVLKLVYTLKRHVPVKIVETVNIFQSTLILHVKYGSRGRISDSTKAPSITATANAIVPSTVFFVRGHRLVPYFLPTILAFDYNSCHEAIP